MTTWPTARLGELLVRRGGSLLPASFPDEEFELYSIPAHDRDGYEVLTGSQIGSAKQIVQPGDVMVSKIVPHIRRARAVGPRTTRRQIASGEWIVFRSDNIDPNYLRHYLLSDGFHAQFMATVAGVGGSLLRARPAAVADLTVPLPPIEEQRRLGAILDHADALQQRLKRRVEELSSLESALFCARFGADEANAMVVEIAAHIRTGPFGSQLLHGEFVDQGVAVLGLDNVVTNEFRWVERRFITSAKYDQLKRYTVHAGDVLISIMGTVGRCVVVPGDIPLAINTKHICAITPQPELALPEFLRAAFLWHPESRAYLLGRTKGAIMDGLNMGIIKGMPVPLASIGRQRDFVREVGAVRMERRRAEAGAAWSESLTASIRVQAFSGRL